MPTTNLTDTDRRLLRLLQRNATASTQELAEAAGLSTSPAWRRLKRLEELGVIRARVTLLCPKALGLRAVAYVHVSLIDHTEPTVARFDAFVQKQSRIMDCARVTGEFDYILKVITRDTEDLETFLMRHLLAMGIVRTTSTNFVLREIKSTTELPLETE